MTTRKDPQNALLQGAPATDTGAAKGRVEICVRDGEAPFDTGWIGIYAAPDNCDGQVLLNWSPGDQPPLRTNQGVLTNGCWLCEHLPEASYFVHFPYPIHGEAQGATRCITIHGGCYERICFDLGYRVQALFQVLGEDCKPRGCAQPVLGDQVEVMLVATDAQGNPDPGRQWDQRIKSRFPAGFEDVDRFAARTFAQQLGLMQAQAEIRLMPMFTGVPEAVRPVGFRYSVKQRPDVRIGGNLEVSHRRRVGAPSGPMAFFVHLLDASNSVGFNAYREFIDRVLCRRDVDGIGAECEAGFTGVRNKLGRLQTELTDHGVGAYELLRTATEAFLLLRCCIRPCDAQSRPAPGAWPGGPYPDNPQLGDYRRIASEQWQGLYCDYRGTLARFLGNNRLSYIDRVVQTAFPEYQEPAPGQDSRFCDEVLLRSRVENPCFMELIWNYWHEEGMLVQAINAVSRRFQNLRAPGQRDPLAHLEIDPLRPLNNILWGYVEHERDRLSIRRRAYEYQHQYGLGLYGKAVANLRPADTRSKFIEAFHNLLNKCADYYRAKQDTTVDPDGYPILHAIQELNLILAQGAHNQFGDLAWNARVDALMQQWILARPELRDFLQSRAMVPYKEAWMPQVDTMKTLQGWSDVVVTHFRDLGVFGEQILLTIRWYNWYDVTSEEEAKDWADLLRAQIQSYIHAYRAVTGVDLSNLDTVDYTIPSVHLRKRLALQQRAR